MNDRGGHLLGLILEFRPGTSILIPSTAIFHSNIPIAVGKHWFQMEEEFLATLMDSQVEEEHLGLTWQRQGWHYSRLLTN
ncbi:hypothetical protein K438DRAFT_196815 [Mycena galopus ATCC 62051]|nr:hypothetical protein K438DRAFT_196815 [Mycena galopus ATCC 62051]